MAVYVPTVHTEVLLQGLFESKTWAALLASGVLDLDTLADDARAGDAVDVPRLDHAADFARVDLASSTPLTPTHLSTTDDKAVVLRDTSVNEFYEHDLVRSGEPLDARLSRSVGEKLAKRLTQQLFRVLLGALDAADSPSTDCHVKDATGSAITVTAIRQAKQMLGDEADALTTLVLDSLVWGDLLHDLTENYKIDVVGGQVIHNGRLQGILGLQNILVTDLCPITPYGASSAGDDQHHSFLLGPNAVYFAYQRAPRTETQKNVLSPSTLFYVKSSMDYVLHLKGVKWTGDANPADADLADDENWGVAYGDHRDVKAVKLITKGGAHA
jgi:hypothetical protein